MNKALVLLICGTFAPASALAQPLSGAGATFPWPLYQKWFATFQKKFSNSGERGVRENCAQCAYSTGQGLMPQISVAYCEIVRSLENFPLLAVFNTALRANSSGSAQSRATLSCASV